MPTLAQAPVATPAPAGFAAVQPSVLRRLDRWDIDLFTLPRSAGTPVLLRDASLPVSELRAQRLADDDEQVILVRQRDFEELSRAMLVHVDELVTDDSLPTTERFALLQFAAAAEVEHACKLVDPGRFVDLAGRLGSSITTLLESGDMPPEDLYRIARHDYHTFAHVTNVASYAVLLAEALGIADREELRQLAVGAFLHDIGKRHIPGEVLRKTTRLTDDERRVVESHAQRGYEDLVVRGDLTHVQLMMVYQHHVHPWAQLLAVVDVFDAMTGQRPYRAPASPADVLQYLEAGAGSHFNPEMVRCWSSTLQPS